MEYKQLTREQRLQIFGHSSVTLSASISACKLTYTPNFKRFI